jgi:hypothetical protein
MRLKVLVTALAASAAVITAGAASAQGLLDGVWMATDDRNPNITSYTEVLSPFINEATVTGICEASTGEQVRFIFDMDSRPTKTNITGTKATIDKNRKEEPAQVWGQLPGLCETLTIKRCFEGAPIDCPGEEPCINAGIPEVLNCERAKVKSTVNANSEKINWSADAKNCPVESAPLAAAVEAACGNAGNNRGITVRVTDNVFKKIKITGKERND